MAPKTQGSNSPTLTKPRQAIRLRPRHNTPRCCACRDDILGERERQRMVSCDRCGVLAHKICKAFLDGCPSPGCTGALSHNDPQEKTEKHQTLLGLARVLALIIVGLILAPVLAEIAYKGFLIFIANLFEALL